MTVDTQRRRAWLKDGVALLWLLVLLTVWTHQRVAVSQPFIDKPVPLTAPGLGVPETRLIEDDPYFHFRQALYTATHYPKVQRHDPWSTYPKIERGYSQGFFDVLLATAAWCNAGGRPSEGAVFHICAWSPIVLSCLILVLVFVYARLSLGIGPALIAATLVVLYPSALQSYSMLGFGDHHPFEVVLLWMCSLGLLASRFVTGSPARLFRLNLLCAAPMLLFMLSWPGAPMHVAGACVFWLLAWILAGRCSAAHARRDLPLQCIAYGSALAVPAVVVGMACPDLVPVLMFVPIYVLLFCLMIALPLPAQWAWSHRFEWKGRGCIALGALLALAMFASGPARRALHGLFGERSTTIAEQAAYGPGWLVRYNGPLLVLAGLGCLSLLWATLLQRRHDQERVLDRALPVLILGGWSLLSWALGGDFSYQVVPVVAYAAAIGWQQCERLPSRARLPIQAVVLIGLVACPLWQRTAPALPQAGLTFPSERMTPMALYDDAMAEVCGFLRRNGGGELSPAQSVLSNWDIGHIVTAMGLHPVLFSATESKVLSSILTARSESEFEHALAGRNPGLWLVDSRTALDAFPVLAEVNGVALKDLMVPGYHVHLPSGDFGLPVYNKSYTNSMLARAYLNDGRDLQHWALVHESPQSVVLAYVADPQSSEKKGFNVLLRSLTMINPTEQNWANEMKYRARGQIVKFGTSFLYELHQQPEVKLFRHVDGYRYAGVAKPFQTVSCHLDLRVTTSGRTLHYSQDSTADAAGKFSMVLPYSTSRECRPGSDVKALGPYRFSAGSRVWTLEMQN